MKKFEKWASMPIDEKIEIMAHVFAQSEGRPYELIKNELMKDREKAIRTAAEIGKFLEETDAKTEGNEKKEHAKAEIIRKSQIYDTDAFFVFSLILGRALNDRYNNNLFLTPEILKQKEEAIAKLTTEKKNNLDFRVWDFTKHDFPILDNRQNGKYDLHIIKLLFAFSKLLTAQSECKFGKGKDFSTLGVAREVADMRGEKMATTDSLIVKGKRPDGTHFNQNTPFPYLAIHGEITDMLQKFYKKKMSASEKEAYKEAYQILINSYACFFKDGNDGTPDFYLTRIFEEKGIQIKINKGKEHPTIIRTLECSPVLLSYANEYAKSFLKIKSEFTETFKGVKSLSDFHVWAYMLTDAILDAKVRKYKWQKDKSVSFDILTDVAMTNAGEAYKEGTRKAMIEKRTLHALDFAVESGIIKKYSISKRGKITYVDFSPNRHYFKDGK